MKCLRLINGRFLCFLALVPLDAEKYARATEELPSHFTGFHMILNLSRCTIITLAEWHAVGSQSR